MAGSLTKFAAAICFCATLSSIARAADTPAGPLGDPGRHWEHVGWGGGGHFWCGVYHPARPGFILIGGDVNGIYRTKDNGENWHFANKGLCDYGIYGLAADTKTPGTFYVGTLKGVCKSVDDGDSWTLLPGTENMEILRAVCVKSIAVDPNDSNKVWIGTGRGELSQSTDGGKTWTLKKKLEAGAAPERKGASDQNHKGASNAVCYVSISKRSTPTVVLVGTLNEGILKSTDDGATWSRLPTPGEAGNCCFSVNFAPSDEKILFAAFADKGVFKSVDGGKTWSAINEGIRSNRAGRCEMREVVIDPQDSNRLCAIGRLGWDGVAYRSDDGGQSWTSATTIHTNPSDPTRPLDGEPDPASGTRLVKFVYPSQLMIDPFNSRQVFMAAGWRMGISTDRGATWWEKDKKADITCSTDVCFDHGKAYVAAMDEGLHMTPDNGATWKAVWPLKYEQATAGHDWRVLAWTQPDGREKIVVTSSPWNVRPQVNQVLISEDGGATFETVRKGLPTNPTPKNTFWQHSFPRALAVNPANREEMYLGMDGDDGGIFKSVDGGHRWQRLPNQPGSLKVFWGIAIDPSYKKGTRIYWAAGTTENGNGGIYRSDDGGDRWVKVAGRQKEFQCSEDWIQNVLVSPTGVVYCPGKNLWRSADQGKTWTKMTKHSGPDFISGIEIDPRDENTVWYSRMCPGTTARGGIFKTANASAGARAAWQDITYDIPYVKPVCLRFEPQGRYLWAIGVGEYRIKQ